MYTTMIREVPVFIGVGTMLLIVTVRNLELLNLTQWALVTGQLCV